MLAILGGEPVRREPFAPWPQYSPEDASRLQQVLESRHWGGFPVPNVLGGEFAQKFAEHHDARYGLCLANGTVALVVALQASGIGFGDEVIVPAFTWEGTAAAVLFAGAIPVFADVDPDTYCLDVAAARRAITPRTKAIMPVHLAMRFADMDALLELAREFHLILIEDCAHAHGGQYKGRGAGSMGDLGCFSFQESKLMTAGEGGIVITSRLDCYEMLQTLINCGRASLTDQYEKRALGSNFRMTEFQAAILLGQLKMLGGFAQKRACRAARLSQALRSIPHVRPLPEQPEITRGTFYNYVFQYRPGDCGVHRDLFVAALEAEGIPCDGRFYEAVYRSDLFHVTPEAFPQLRAGSVTVIDFQSFHCPVSERAAYDESVWLPQFLLIGEEADVEDVIAAVAKVAANLDELAGADPALAGLKAMSRIQRARFERQRNY